MFFRGVWEKYRESDVSKFCKISRASIKWTSKQQSISINVTLKLLKEVVDKAGEGKSYSGIGCAYGRHSFWDKNFFRFTSISLASKLVISGRIRFSSAHVVRTVGHIKFFIIFLVFTFATFSINSCSYFASQSEDNSANVSKLESI